MANTADIFKRLKVSGNTAKETQPLKKQENPAEDLSTLDDDDLLDLSQFIDIDDEFDIERLLK